MDIMVKANSGEMICPDGMIISSIIENGTMSFPDKASSMNTIQQLVLAGF